MESGTTVPHALTAPRLAPLAALWHVVVAQRTRIALTAITAVGLGLRLWGLASKSLWIDETFSIGMATQSWPSFLHTIVAVQPNMELFYLLIKVLVTLTPIAWQQGEFFWRLLPALAGAATIPATFALARRLFPTRVALGAAALVAVNEFMVEYSQQARGYTLFVLLLTLSYLALARWLAGEQRALIWFAVLSVLGFLTQAFEVVFLAGQVAFVLVVALRRHGHLPWRPLALALVPLAAIVAMRYPLYAAHPDQVAWIPRPTVSDLWHGVRQIVGGDGGVPSRAGDALLLIVLLALGALIAWAVMARRQAAADPTMLAPVESAALVALWFIIPIAGTWLGSQVKPLWVTRYLAPCSVAGCLIIAAGLHALAEMATTSAPLLRQRRISSDRNATPARLAGAGFSRLRAPFVFVFISALALVLLASAWPLRAYVARPGWEDWRGAAQTVYAQFQTSDGIVCYDNQWGCDFGFSHYFQSFGGVAQFDPTAPGVFSWATYGRPDREAIFAQAVSPTALAPYLAAHPRLWVLLGHYTSGVGDWHGGLAWLNAHAHLLRATTFAGDIEVYLYQSAVGSA